MPEPVVYRSRDSGWRSRNARSSLSSQSLRMARTRAMASGSNMTLPHFPVEVAVVDHPASLELRARQRAVGHQVDHRVDAQPGPQPLAHRALEGLPGLIIGVGRRELGADQQLIHRLPAGDDDAKLAAEALDGAERVLDRARVDVLAPHDEHVVEPPVDA